MLTPTVLDRITDPPDLDPLLTPVAALVATPDPIDERTAALTPYGHAWHAAWRLSKTLPALTDDERAAIFAGLGVAELEDQTA